MKHKHYHQIRDIALSTTAYTEVWDEDAKEWLYCEMPGWYDKNKYRTRTKFHVHRAVMLDYAEDCTQVVQMAGPAWRAANEWRDVIDPTFNTSFAYRIKPK